MNAPRFQKSAADVAGMKAAARTAWSRPGAGYQEMAETLRPAVEHLLEFAGIHASQRVLDIATGTGIAALGAARRGARVIGIDFAPDLISEARRLATADDLADRAEFLVADAEELPFEDASFDAVISTFGSIFAPRHDALAWQMSRVLRPGGTLAFATWKPEGPNLRLMTLLVPFMAERPPERPGPLSWGCADYIEERFAPFATDFQYVEGNVPWRASSPSDAIDMLYRRALGPTMELFNSFDLPTQLAAHNASIALLRDNLAPDGSVDLARDYLLVRATRT